MGLNSLSGSESPAGHPADETGPDSAPPAVGLLWALAFTYLLGDALAAWFDHGGVEPRSLLEAGFLVLVSIVLSLISVRLPVGYITLSGIATNAAALTLGPRLALGVGFLTGTVMATFPSRSPALVRLSQPFAVGLWTVSGSWLDLGLVHLGAAAAVREPIVVTEVAVANLLLTGLIFVGLLRLDLRDVLRRNASRHWFGAFAYFGVAAILMANLLDGSLRGFVLSTLVAVLSLALGDSVAGREVRVRLQAQLRDAERYVLHSRVVEGTIHDVRNFLAVGLGQLDEAIEDASTESATLARSAFHDAVDLLNRLQMGSSPELHWSPDPIDLNAIAQDVATVISATASQKRVALVVDPAAPAQVKGDPVLLRHVVTNLVLNAIEAVATGGHVSVRVGTRGGRAVLSVIDDGPGVPDKYRDRLFEPHFTTKPSGSGIGLFISFGIVREHGGELLYEGSKKGGVFTVLLPQA